MRALAKVVPVSDAVAQIPSGSVVAVSGFVGAAHPEQLTAELEQRFLRTGQPRDLTLIYAAGQGDGATRGLNHLAHQGLVRRVIGGHWNLAPKMGRLALEEKIEAYNFPQGVLSILFREIAAKRSGVITKVGMGTFVDPLHGGGRFNNRTHDSLVERIQLGGEDWLWYRAIPLNVGLIRATRADSFGNLTMEKEGIIGEVLPIAQATHNNGGIVIAQVEELVELIEDPKSVCVPGILVDYVVLSDPSHHEQTFSGSFEQDFIQRSVTTTATAPLAFSERKIVARRALNEIRKGDIVNLGIGMPEAIPPVANEENRLCEFTLTVESGPIGGMPAAGMNFGCSYGPEAIIDQPAQFDFYDGGGLDVAALGAIEVDEEGNVNVSTFPDRFAGVGGFINISQNTKKILFCCSFRAGGLAVTVGDDGKLHIAHEGTHSKFVKRVQSVCFHGPSARERGQDVIYITERAVFRLGDKGLELVEIAPGMDLHRDILDRMDFRPVLRKLVPMPADCFRHSIRKSSQ
ncbi:MAG: malonate decarboxylase subunit alpha [Verrucomicrobia bacterium]|nr:malonate decarboxylase subunit alpha [Verrucomicrobiota bacterium]